MGIDMRWIAIAGLLFAFGAFIVLYKPSVRSAFFLGVLAFLLFWWIVADNTPGIVSVSEEGVVIGYYASACPCPGLRQTLADRNRDLAVYAEPLCTGWLDPRLSSYG